MIETLFDNERGTVYLVPTNESKQFILCQVGFGGDLAVFSGLHAESMYFEEDTSSLIFRVNFGLLSPKRHKWRNLGLKLFKQGLSNLNPYLYNPIGSNNCYLVYLDGREESIDCLRAHEFEILSTWSHEHIVERFFAHKPE